MVLKQQLDENRTDGVYMAKGKKTVFDDEWWGSEWEWEDNEDEDGDDDDDDGLFPYSSFLVFVRDSAEAFANIFGPKVGLLAGYVGCLRVLRPQVGHTSNVVFDKVLIDNTCRCVCVCLRTCM